MTLDVQFHPEALAELRADVAWYEDRGPGQPADALGAGFPYRLVYLVQAKEVVVVAPAHERRKPGYWRDRLS